MGDRGNGFPFGAGFDSGVRVALGDFTNDGVNDIVAAMGPGGGLVKLVDGASGSEVGSGLPFGSGFAGGVNVAVGEFDGDGRPDVVTAQASGGSVVAAFSGVTYLPLFAVWPFGPDYRGGVSIATGDVTGDRVSDIIVGQVEGGAVSLIDGATHTVILGGVPFGGSGVFVAAGDVTGDGRAEVIAAPAFGAGPVLVYDVRAMAPVAMFMPYNSADGYSGGVRVAASDLDGDDRAEIITVPGPGSEPLLKVFDGATLRNTSSTLVYSRTFRGGVVVAAAASSNIKFQSPSSTTFTVGTAGSFTVRVKGPGTATISMTGTLPTGVTFTSNGNDTATLAGTPAAGTSGVYPLTFSASSGSGAPATQSFTLTVNQAPAITSPASATFGLGVAGSFSITTTGYPQPTVSLTGTLPTGITFTQTAGGGTLAGTAGAGTAGTYPVTITASNGVNPAATQSFVLSITSAPAFTSAASATFVVGTAASFSVTTSALPAVTSITRTGTLPGGIAFNDNGNGTATLSGTAAAGSAGSYPLTFTASNGTASAQQNFTLTVNQAPAITSSNATSFALGANGTFTVTATGFPTPTLSRTGTLPTGVSFTNNGNGTATLAGTPAAGTAGSYSLTFTASNGVGTNAVQAFTLTVTAPPAITSAASTTFVAGAPATFTVTATGGPVPTLSRTGALPTGVDFTDNGNGTATIAGTPAAGSGGTYPITITATNSGGTAQQNFTLTVNQAPAITSSNATAFPLGTNGTFSITTTGFPTPTLSRTGTLPSGVSFTDNGNGTATLAGTPAAGTAGSYTQTLTASNGVGTNAVQTFTLTVTAAPAITSAASATFVAGTPGTFTVTATGGPTPTLSRTGNLPTGVNFTDNGNGTATIAGTPAAGSGGNYPITITATNSGGTAQQNFTLTVNQAPAITSANAVTFTRNIAGSFTITTTGFPVPTVSVTGSLPAGVTFTASPGGGTLSGTSTAAPGPYVVTIGASNGVGSPASQSFTLTIVSGSGGGPTAANDTFSNGVGNTQYSVGAGAPATPAVVVSGSVLTNDTGTAPLSAGPASIASTNGGQVAMSSNGSFLYTPPAGFAGPSDTFTYTLTDGNAGTSTAVVTINLTGVVWYVNAAASAGGTGRSNSPFNTMTAAASAAQANQVIYVHAGSPAGATLLKQGQTLWGAGAAFTLNGLTIPAATAPVLQSTITLANGVLVNSLSVNGGGAAAIAATGLSGTETLNAVSITGGATGLQLTGVGGTFTVSGGSITGVTAGADVLISGGTGAVTIGSAITNTGGRSIDIQNRTAGTVNFTGAINDTGTGILLNANTGSTIAFSGGLALATGDADAFTATGGGTVTATQNNTTIVNTIVTNAGTALNITNSDIGSSGMTFRSISAGSSSDTPGIGIVLDHTGVGQSNGGLTVTGTGATATGGRIWKKTGSDGSTNSGVGIYLNTTKSPSFNWMDLYSFDNAGIVGREVQGFLLADSAISVAGTTSGLFEGPLVFGLPGSSGVNGLVGSGTLRNVVITGAIEDTAAFYNRSGSMTLDVVRTTTTLGDCTLADTSDTAGSAGLRVHTEGNAAATVTVNGCRFRNNRVAGVLATTTQSSNLSVSISGSEFVRGQNGALFSNSGDSSLTVSVLNSQFGGYTNTGVRVGQVPFNASALSQLRATVSGNQFESADNVASSTILARLSSTPGQAAHARVLISNNGNSRIPHYGLAPAISVEATDAGTAPDVQVTMFGNHVDMYETFPGSNQRGPIGTRVRVSQGTLCGNLINNISHWFPIESGTGGGFSAEQAGTATFLMERGAAALGADPATVLQTNNGGSFTPTSVSGTLQVVENGSCLLPTAAVTTEP